LLVQIACCLPFLTSSDQPLLIFHIVTPIIILCNLQKDYTYYNFKLISTQGFRFLRRWVWR
jgi:hypothetical protein